MGLYVEVPAMDRRELIRKVSAGMLAAAAPAVSQVGGLGRQVLAMNSPATVSPMGDKPIIGMLVYPQMVLLDLIGPMTVFNILGCEIHLIWKEKIPVATDVRIPVMPTATFDECPVELDVLFIPGGVLGTADCMNDEAVLNFVAHRGTRARFVTAVCTGTMVLAAAGLLKGYRATTLWALMNYLPLLGAKPVHQRVVRDRNRITGGGVTAGIDFGLTIAGILRGRSEAKRVQLIIEYAPDPPFDAGTPNGAGTKLVAEVTARRKSMDARVEAAARSIREGWTRGE
jgi:cyclohexyl-isocyanide hydratase